MARPYQPSLLRLLHGITALLVPLSWLLIPMAVGLHGSAVLQRGGWPLARSMASLQVRTGDLPGNWLHQIRRSFKA